MVRGVFDFCVFHRAQSRPFQFYDAAGFNRPNVWSQIGQSGGGVYVFLYHARGLCAQSGHVPTYGVWRFRSERYDLRHAVYLSVHGVGRVSLRRIFGFGAILCDVRRRPAGGAVFLAHVWRPCLFKSQSARQPFYRYGRKFLGQYANLGLYRPVRTD